MSAKGKHRGYYKVVYMVTALERDVIQAYDRDACRKHLLPAYCEQADRCGYLLTSVSVGWPNRWSVAYIPGQWTGPVIAGSKLFVLDSLDAAEEYTRDWVLSARAEIWRVSVRGVSGHVRYVPGCRMQNWDEVWRNARVVGDGSNKTVLFDVPGHELLIAPNGTVLVDKVKLMTRER